MSRWTSSRTKSEAVGRSASAGSDEVIRTSVWGQEAQPMITRPSTTIERRRAGTQRPPVYPRGHAPRPVHIVIDADDVDGVCDFWVAALGYERFGTFEQYRSAIPANGAPGPKFIFQQVPEGRAAGKNRLHVDIEVGDELHSECERLLALGATR